MEWDLAGLGSRSHKWSGLGVVWQLCVWFGPGAGPVVTNPDSRSCYGDQG